jgi:site-specific recombinase XerD
LGLAEHFERFLSDHLPKQSLAQNTITSYGDSLRLLLQFTQRYLKKEAYELDLTVINRSVISAFLDDLENRGISAGSRNLRLSAIRSFCRYAAAEVPSGIYNPQHIFAIPQKKYVRPEVDFLSSAEAEAVLAAPDRTTWSGRRDYAFLLIALQTGMLVSEMTRLTVHDLELNNGAQLRVIGDGRKKRRIPLTNEAVTLLQSWIQELARSKKKTLFPNARGGRLTHDGVRYIINRHIGAACEVCPSLQVKHVTPFILRHTKAMQMLRSGMYREEIAIWLGLESVDSLQPYIKANFENDKKLIREKESKLK